MELTSEKCLGTTVSEFKKGLREFQENADDVVGDVERLKNDAISEAKDASGLNDFDTYR